MLTFSPQILIYLFIYLFAKKKIILTGKIKNLLDLFGIFLLGTWNLYNKKLNYSMLKC
jgi:hypothetical protein